MDRKSRPREVEVTALKRQPIAVKNPDLGIRPINFNQSRSGGRSSDSEGNNYHRDRLQSGLIPKVSALSCIGFVESLLVDWGSEIRFVEAWDEFASGKLELESWKRNQRKKRSSVLLSPAVAALLEKLVGGEDGMGWVGLGNWVKKLIDNRVGCLS
ncbi:hypothetical protein LINPERHAP1_LOCUS24784 [Linum perenne]